ncbi:MAG TPA: hypothetical protein VM120_02180 [Bryobacteraceae bacterium]|nr:hypothetical protein [Bryobacteraceae bacterium]
MISPTTFNITTVLLLALTVWVVFMRYRTRPESNWPLFYYVALVAFTKKFDLVINPAYVFVAVVAALLIRFEWMSGWLLKTIMYIETACLVYVIIRCVQILFGNG